MKKMSLSAMDKKTHKLLSGITAQWQECLGDLEPAFTAIIWGASANGKSNFTMQLVKLLAMQSRTLYVALEESFSLSLQNSVKRHDMAGTGLKLWFANHETNYDSLLALLKKKQSPQVIVIDSLQYFAISYVQYKHLKELFPCKTFIFISHAKGNLPDGKTADKIRYDAGIKIRVEGFIAFIASRYGGTRNFVIWEEGAKKYWGKQFKKMQTRI